MREASERSVAGAPHRRKAIKSAALSQRDRTGVGLGSVLAQPQDLAQAEDGLQRQPRDGKQAVGADLFVQPLRLGLGAAVEPGDRLVGGLAVVRRAGSRFRRCS